MQGRKKEKKGYFSEKKNYMNKKVWFCKRNFIVLEKCVAWKIQIQIFFINDLEEI